MAIDLEQQIVQLFTQQRNDLLLQKPVSLMRVTDLRGTLKAGNSDTDSHIIYNSDAVLDVIWNLIDQGKVKLGSIGNEHLRLIPTARIKEA